jgi:hypothetical protein
VVSRTSRRDGIWRSLLSGDAERIDHAPHGALTGG